MDDRHIEFFKAALNRQLNELLNQADLAVTELVSQDGQEIENIDRASAHANQALKLKIRTRESLLIRKVRESLERIENNVYGICESCGEEISIRRLEARPVTSKCIECKEEEEKSEVSYP